MKYFLNFIVIVVGSILILVISYLILTYGFKWNPLWENTTDNLHSAYEAKKYGIFHSEYYCPKQYVEFLDGSNLEIIESWIEYGWSYNKWSKPTKSNDELYYLNVKFILNKDKYFSTISNGYELCWNNNVQYFKIDSNKTDPYIVNVATKIKIIPDTLKIIIDKRVKNSNIYDTIANFILLKKK